MSSDLQAELNRADQTVSLRHILNMVLLHRVARGWVISPDRRGERVTLFPPLDTQKRMFSAPVAVNFNELLNLGYLKETEPGSEMFTITPAGQAALAREGGRDEG